VHAAVAVQEPARLLQHLFYFILLQFILSQHFILLTTALVALLGCFFSFTVSSQEAAWQETGL